MKYLINFNESVSLVQQKCDILDELTTELRDLGLYVIVTPKPIYYDGIVVNTSSEIGIVIHDKNDVFKSYSLYDEPFMKEFIEICSEYGFKYNSISSGAKHCYIRFAKHGRKTNSPFLRRN